MEATESEDRAGIDDLISLLLDHDHDKLSRISPEWELSSSTSEENLDMSRQQHAQRNGGIYFKPFPCGRVEARIILPKILKTDIRRFYPRMYCETHNSGDPEKMKQFLYLFTTEDVLFSHNIQSVSATVDLLGRRRVLYSWTRVAQAIPDKTFTLLKAQVIFRSDGTSIVHMEVDIRGTLLIEEEQPLAGMISGQRSMDKYCLVYLETLRESLLLADDGEGTCGEMGRRGKIKLVCLQSSGRVSLHLDANNAIHRVDYVCGLPTATV